MPNINNEGFAITPQAECVNGLKPAFWSDDNGTDGHAIRTGTINCTVLDLDADNDGINDDVDYTYPPGTSQVNNPNNNTFSDVAGGGATSGKIVNRNGHVIGVADAANPRAFMSRSGRAPLRRRSNSPARARPSPLAPVRTT